MLQQEDGQEADLAKRIQAAQQRVHESLLDNLNSKAALDALLELVKDTNKYLADRQGNTQGLLILTSSTCKPCCSHRSYTNLVKQCAVALLSVTLHKPLSLRLYSCAH